MTAKGPLAHIREHPEINARDLAYISEQFPQARRVLDIGAGRGDFVNAARGQGLEACGLELETDAIALWSREGIPGVVGDGLRTPFRDGAFDLVRLKEVIEHVRDPLALVREGRRLLRPGGMLIAHVPSPYSQFYPVANFWDDYTHVRPFSREGLTRLVVDAGLRVVRIDGYVAGRNAVEKAVGAVLSRVLPHVYRVVARADAEP